MPSKVLAVTATSTVRQRSLTFVVTLTTTSAHSWTLTFVVALTDDGLFVVEEARTENVIRRIVAAAGSAADSL